MAKTLVYLGSTPSQSLNDLDQITSPFDVVSSSIPKLLWVFNEKLTVEHLEWCYV